MPPKRKAKSATNSSAAAKKSKLDPVVTTAKTALQKAASFSKKTHKVDSHCHLSNANVYQDYDCMLNQTNIGHNNNKYYVIQLLQSGNTYYTWNRWGRVGESGANALKNCGNLEAAKKSFESKFKDKTANSWDNKSNFSPRAGKYTLLDMGEDDGNEESTVVPTANANAVVKMKPSALDSPTQLLMKLIFSTEMFNNALEQFKIDTKKMPLGKLSKNQIVKGFEVLEKIENGIKSKTNTNLTQLSSEFYTLIPHDFGRMVPPVLNTQEKVREKMDMLLVLADIEVAQAMQKTKKASATGTEAPNYLDENYNLLNCDLDVIKPGSSEDKLIRTYVTNTKQRTINVLHIWKANRRTEGQRYKSHDGISNRKLLWHGTNVAVVAAILKTGLRIMPHSGGRVGRGLYFASENGKSAWYVSAGPGNVGIMFLVEVALGKQNEIKVNNCSLTAPPSGFDSVVARGNTEPDPTQNAKLTIEGREIVIPQGKPLPQKQFSDSHFSQSEYLIYKESQCRLRYVLMCKFS